VAVDDDAKAEEIVEIVREIRERVRARYPGGSVANVILPDLLPILRARDAAEAKVAAIGSVNPRPPGPLNSILQFFKRSISRALDWHVRDQVEFNRGMITAVEAVLEALNENNRALGRLAANGAERDEFNNRLAASSGELGGYLRELKERLEAFRQDLRALERRAAVLMEEAAELKDIRKHWFEWRQEWEKKLSINEVQFLRNVADLEAGFTHRASLMEANFRDLNRGQHKEFTAQLECSVTEIQKQLWADIERSRMEFERLIHSQLRLVRQRSAPLATTEAQANPEPESHFDAMWFAERFRGSPEYVRERQRFYLPFFKDRRSVLDIGCGRGEFLELMKEAGAEAAGIELNEECVTLCRSRGLTVEKADLFTYLNDPRGLPVDGILMAQVVEHLPPERLSESIHLAAARLSPGGVIAIETPNPECLAIFATHFYLDPSHTRPVPAALLNFYMEESGFGGIEIHRLSPAVESLPGLASLPADFREAFFGGLDFAIIGRKL
jgi:O-antigen chain-terminating methyltransferase